MEKLGKEKLTEISEKIGEQLYDQCGISTMITMVDKWGITNHFAGKLTVLELLTIAYDCINKTVSESLT